MQDSVYEEVVERLVARANAVRLGDPGDRGTAMGPLVSAVQMKRVLDYIEIGQQEGARLVAGGTRHGERGYFLKPTVFADVEHGMRISQEEIFGPVAAVLRFRDEEQAIRIANGTRYSLAAGVWSADIGRVHRVVRRLKAGTVWVNTFGPTDVRLPWGGAGDSGLGREHGDTAIENFTEPKGGLDPYRSLADVRFTSHANYARGARAGRRWCMLDSERRARDLVQLR